MIIVQFNYIFILPWFSREMSFSMDQTEFLFIYFLNKIQNKYPFFISWTVFVKKLGLKNDFIVYERNYLLLCKCNA